MHALIPGIAVAYSRRVLSWTIRAIMCVCTDMRIHRTPGTGGFCAASD
jgi:hypothetical protein